LVWFTKKQNNPLKEKQSCPTQLTELSSFPES
jgi:hypothetical protein